MSNFDFSKARACVDDINNRYYLFVPNLTNTDYRCLVYDFYFGEWFLMLNMDCSEGLAANGSNVIFHSTDGFKQFNYSSDQDNGVDVACLWEGNWDSYKGPEFKTKSLFMCLFSIPSSVNEESFAPSFALNIEQAYNWSSVFENTNTISFNTGNYRNLLKLNSNQIYAHKFKLSWNGAGLVSAVSVFAEDMQGKPTE